jgi:tetratricopeptide (TPR) repeat protein
MTPEQYERLAEMFHAVMEVAPQDRAVFLKQISDGDADLQHQLESLLAAYQQHKAQTQKSPDDIAAAIFLAHGEGSGASAASLVPNTRLAHYEIRSLLGKGGMGEVYLAEDLRLHRKVALKVLPAEVVFNRDKMRRFEQEAQSAAALNHPNIAHIYEIGESENTHFIALEYIDGDTLRNKIHRDKAPLQKLLKYLLQVAEGLSKAHAAGIVHRDLKPDNIMITHDDYAKILDFGLAKLIEPQKLFATTSTATTALHSLAGIIMGTAGYMSPEQARGRVNEIDHRSDIFSFGCILFEAVTGQRAFVGESFIESLHRVVHESPPPIKKFNPSAPPDLQRIVRRCLAKDRDERYQTIKDVAIELKEINVGMAGAVQATEVSARLASRFRFIADEIRRRSVAATIAVATLILAASVFAYFSYFKRNVATKINDQYKILIMGIENRTGDAEFDGTLELALVVQLEQSPFLTILSSEQLISTLRFMSVPLDAGVTPEVVRELSERQGVNVMLAGSITPLDAHYVLTLEAIDTRTQDVLARTQTEAESKERVLEALRNAANELRQKLGESLVSIRKFDVPLEQATTSSLEALKSFAIAMHQFWPDDSRKISLYKRAIELDSNFALAYARLSDCYVSSDQQELALDAARKAFELRGRVSEWERLGISIRYYQMVTGEWDKVVDTAQLQSNTYPGTSPQPFNLMAMDYRWSGQYEEAIEAANEAIRRPPIFAAEYENLGKAFMSLNRFAEAKEAFEQGLTQQQFESKDIRWGLYALAFINRDSEAMQQQLDAVVRWRTVSISWPAETAVFAGQRQRAHELALTEQSKPKEATAQYASLESLWDAAFGRCQQSKAMAAQAVTLPNYRASLSKLGLALALCGESAQLRKLIADVKEHHPKATFVNNVYLPMIQAAGELRNDQPALAIQTLDSIGKYEAVAGFWPRYLRGQAYLKLHRAAEAALEFQRILDHRGEDPLSFLYPLAHVGLARAAALDGDSHKSRKAYEDFFTLWKDADTDLPVLIEAKNEYKKVR